MKVHGFRGNAFCDSVYICLVITCWERADLLALVCGIQLWVCHFPIGILGQVWYLIVSIPDLCTCLTLNNDGVPVCLDISTLFISRLEVSNN